MNKKIASEFAIGVILLLAIIVGGIFWIKNVREMAALDHELNQIKLSQKNDILAKALKQPEQKAEVKDAVEDGSCKNHYFEGSDKFSGWFVSQESDGIIVAIKKSDVSKFPTTNYRVNEKEIAFNVKLIDPTDKVTEKLKAASAKKPATITLQGYAEACQDLPLISLQPATIAFKK